MTKVIYQGTTGSFSEAAARRFLQGTCVGVESFERLFEALEDGSAEVGCVPIENSLIGPIYENEDLLLKHAVVIVGELHMKIEHALLAVKGDSLEGIRKVFSHPKALEQCRAFFKAHPWLEPVIAYDTAGAAEQIAKSGDLTHAAIASEIAAKHYGLALLRQNLEDNPQNYTRFVFVRRGGGEVFRADKCSLLFALAHRPGALVKVLGAFAKRGINLSRISSRPRVGHPFEYLFYVDCEYEQEKMAEVKAMLETLQKEVLFLKILGFYKRARR